MPTTTTPTETHIYISDIDAGDTVILPGEDTTRMVVRTWFVQKSRDHAIQVVEGANGRDDIYTFHAGDIRKAVLLDRPGYGPFGRNYEIGDRVYYRFGNRDQIFGVVTGYDVNPLDPDDRAYEIRSATSTGYAGATSMRYVDQPAYAVGQTWRCTVNDRRALITQVDDIGLICSCELDTGTIADFVLAAPHWELIEEASK